MSSFESVLDTLYGRYYASDAPSAVTSSYWRTVGGHRVTVDRSGYRLHGHAFGDGRSRSLRNRLQHWIIEQRLIRMLRRYDAPAEYVAAGRRIARCSDRLFGFDCAKQVLAFARILPMVPAPRCIAVIGDGYGYGGALLATLNPNATIVSVNLGRTQLFDVAYTQRCFPDASVALLTAEGPRPEARFVFVEAEAMDRLHAWPIDLFVNSASMQEMDPAVIANYFRIMRSSTAPQIYFYCANRVEKTLPDGTVTRFRDYPWQPSTALFDELCPWHRAYPVLAPPFWRPFDGDVQHRLVRFQ